MPQLAGAVEAFQVLRPDGSTRLDPPDLSDERLCDLYRWMLFGRELDQRGLALQRQGRLTIWGPMIGQEAAQAGLAAAMQPGDWIFPSYREATALCMRGLSVEDLLGYLRGLYWLANPHDTGVWPIQIVIGDQSLHAVGAGVGFALQHKPSVAIASIGDGATSEGDFHEALNFAAVLKAQAVIFIQNNQWAISMPRERQTASETLAQKALAYGIPGALVDGNDVLAVYEASRWAIQRARSGEGPALVEAFTYRLGAHTTADDPTRYQPAEEIAAWQERDPLTRMRRFLEGRGLWDAEQEAKERARVVERVDEGIRGMDAVAVPPIERVFETTYGAPTQEMIEQRGGL